MYFNYRFLTDLSFIEKMPLPGRQAHNQIMDAGLRRTIFKKANHPSAPLPAAVLALLYPAENRKVRMVFILRKSYQGYHSGQISFPGGKAEKNDTGLQQTALRETQEEIGILPQHIQIIKQLSPLFIPVSNFKVTPFLGVTSETPEFIPDPYEVADVIEVDFEAVLQNPFTSIKQDYFGKTYTLQSFEIDGLRIWGATAMILAEIRRMFKELRS